MKKFLLLLVVMFATYFSIASSRFVVTPKHPNASEVKIMLGNGKSISLFELSRIGRKELEELTGRKMNLIERLEFNGVQRKLKNSINDNGIINDKKLQKLADKGESDVTEGFHLGGFALGFLLSLVGVLIAYLIKDGKKKARVKWAWIGFAAWILIFLLFSVAF